jgi:hypothetical protein
MLGQRGANLLNDIRTMTPIIGQQGRFMFVWIFYHVHL